MTEVVKSNQICWYDFDLNPYVFPYDGNVNHQADNYAAFVHAIVIRGSYSNEDSRTEDTRCFKNPMEYRTYESLQTYLPMWGDNENVWAVATLVQGGVDASNAVHSDGLLEKEQEMWDALFSDCLHDLKTC